jgi:hypothetical protein
LVELAALAVVVEQPLEQIMVGAVLTSQLLALVTLDMDLVVEEETLNLHSMLLEAVEVLLRLVEMALKALKLMGLVETEERIL